MTFARTGFARAGSLCSLVLLAVAGCGTGGQDGAVAGAPVWGHTFVLTSATIDDTPMATPSGVTVELEFTADHELRARGGCNTWSGGASLEDGRITVSDFAGTATGCEEALLAHDEWLTSFLADEPSWRFDAGSRLVLSGSDTELVFTDKAVAAPPVSLADVPWTVDTLVSGQVASSVPAGVPAPTLRFSGGEVQVFAGCNMGSAGYSVAEDVLRFERLVLTDAACPAAAMAVERTVSEVLSGEATFTVSADRLTVRTASGTGLGLRAG